VLFAYLKLPHLLPVVIVLTTTMTIALIVDRQAPLGRFAAILFGMLGAQLVIGIVNELVDLELDRAARPDKPLVNGSVSRRGAITYLCLSALLMLAATSTLGWRSMAICLIGCATGVAYSTWCKRTVLAALPYLIALPLLPIWVAVSLDAFEPAWLAAFPLGWAAILGVQIAQSLPDVASDRAAGIRSLTTLLGERRSLQLCWGALLAAAAIIGGTGVAGDNGRVAAALVTAFVLAHAFTTRARPRLGVRLAFPVAAASTALLGVSWVVALT
jgi:4-hydroxybenzoate polyprenyltransferase